MPNRTPAPKRELLVPHFTRVAPAVKERIHAAAAARFENESTWTRRVILEALEKEEQEKGR